MNVQEPEVPTLEEGSDEHSTPSSVTNSISAKERVTDAEGDEHSTPSGTKDSKDVIVVPVVDVTNRVQANGGESDEHSTPSTEQRGERGHRSTNERSITKQMVTNEQEISSSQINIPKLGWLGTQVTHLVETIAYRGSKVGMGGKANNTNKCKANTQNQSEFSFFL